MNWERLREKILENYYPSADEIKEAEDLYSRISNYIKEQFGVDTEFCGSTARKTFIKGDKDVDIFLLFDKSLSESELERKGLRIGEKTFEKFDGEYEKEYAEHPYTKGHIEGVEVEIVPCYDLPEGRIKSSVDRTPHHTKWALERLSEKQKEDVVILKAFLNANELYGSSLKNRGFSGYLCEILIYEYQSFKSLIDQSQEWGEKKILDPEDHHQGDLPDELQNKFSESNLIVIDPTDPERNVASVLSTENYSKYIYNTIKFSEDPGIDKFTLKDLEYTNTQLKNELDKRATVTVLEMPEVNQVDDIVYPQMRKTLKRMSKIIKRNDFRLYNKGFHISQNKIRIYFETDDNLPKVKEVQGPAPYHGKEHVLQFKKNYENVWVENSHLKARKDREHSRIKNLIKSEMPRNQEKLRNKGIPENIAKSLEDYRITDPIQNDQKWLNYLGEQFNIDNQ